MRVIAYNVGPLDNNTYVLLDESTGDAALVDPSFDSRPIWGEVQRSGWTVTRILNTHAHIDHVVENVFFAKLAGAPLFMHEADVPLLEAMDAQARWMGIEPPEVMAPNHLLSHGDQIDVGSSKMLVTHTPGHSPGSISFVGDGFVVSGDVLFAGSIGRTDLPGGSLATLLKSIQTQLYSLADETIVYPGHGISTTIGQERRTNPFTRE